MTPGGAGGPLSVPEAWAEAYSLPLSVLRAPARLVGCEAPPLGEGWRLTPGFDISARARVPGSLLVLLGKDRPPRPGTWTNPNGTVRVGPGLCTILGVPPRTIEQANGIPAAVWTWLEAALRAGEVVYVAVRNRDGVYSTAFAADTHGLPGARADLTKDDGTRLFDRSRWVRWPSVPLAT